MQQNNSIKNYFFFLSTSIIIIAGIKIASEVVIILFLSIFIASIFSSLLQFLQEKGFPKVISYFTSIILFILITFSLAFIINISIKDFASNLPLYQQQFNHLLVSSIGLVEHYGYTLDKKTILETLNFSSFFNFSTNIIGSIGTFFSKFLLVIIGVAFILAEAKSIEKKLKIIFNHNIEKLSHIKLFSKNIKKYFIVKSTTSFLTGLIIAIMLMIFGVDYPILWGVLAMLFNFVPVIGSIIAAIPAVLISLILSPIEVTIAITILYVIINISISNIIEPKLMGKELGLSPLVIFFSLILWGYILGIVGMFLAVPITMTLKIAFDSTKETKWLGILMSDFSKTKN